MKSALQRGSESRIAPRNDLAFPMQITNDCVADVRAIVLQARKSVVRQVNQSMTLAYWLVGRRLVVEEQLGDKRADYGTHLLRRISRELTAEFGKGFAEPQLRNCRLFYQAYPTNEEIRYALRINLTWTHHRAIMRVGDTKARAYYLREAAERGLSARQIEREIRSCAYERVRANLKKTSRMPCAADATPETLLKDPCVAEFLNLREDLRGKEKKVEQRILDNIENFLLELGKGFALVGRQVRIPTESSAKYVDLVFYNYLLKCFVLVDLKTSRLTSRDIGQMDTYRRMFDALKKSEGDNPTVGILLGTDVDVTDVEYSVMSDCKRLFATKLLPYMPTREELEFEIERARERNRG